VVRGRQARLELLLRCVPADDRRRLLDLEKEVDSIKAEVIVMWHRLRRVIDELADIRAEAAERQSRDAIDRYRDELPSETQLSLRPTRVRLFLKNARPSTFVIFVLVLGVVALTWLLRRP
jgi:hypothetical protein